MCTYKWSLISTKFLLALILPLPFEFFYQKIHLSMLEIHYILKHPYASFLWWDRPLLQGPRYLGAMDVEELGSSFFNLCISTLSCWKIGSKRIEKKIRSTHSFEILTWTLYYHAFNAHHNVIYLVVIHLKILWVF